MNLPFPEIVPPGSVVRLMRSDDTTPTWRGREGQTFRIGYYTPNDGLNVIWLVNETGEYIETVDRETLVRFFNLESISEEGNHFGAAQ
jgi:hypothetical protein